MAANRFVGRSQDSERIAAVLQGREKAGGKLTILSIEGSGGIGKTYLFDHVREQTDISACRYLVLKLDGNDPMSRTLTRDVVRLVDSAEASALRAHPPGYYFPNVHAVLKVIDEVKAKVVAEFQNQDSTNNDLRETVSQLLDSIFSFGKAVNDGLPVTKKYIEARKLEKYRPIIEETLPKLQSLRKESRWLGGIFPDFNGAALRNAVKENACRSLAEAMKADFSAILSGYQEDDWWKPRHRKIQGIDRLLIILDDFEALASSLATFLVEHLLPTLQTVDFKTVMVILGRDQLFATHPGWDQHLKSSLLESIILEPLSRQEMDQLVETHGVIEQEEKDRAWKDTQGYPYYVQLWIEETKSGGRSAVMLKRFYDRTTRWMSESEKPWLDITLFLDEVNIRTLQRYYPDRSEAERVYQWFEHEGSIRDTKARVFRVREYLRSRLLDYLQIRDPDRYWELHKLIQIVK